MPSRRQLEEHVEALRQEHEGGRGFAQAVEAYARTLDADERSTLAEVLLDRADDDFAERRSVAIRLETRGWFRRQLDKLDAPRKPRP